MYNFLIIIEATSNEYQEEIKKVCNLNKCTLSRVREIEGNTHFEITTSDPVNFFHLGRRWLDFDNILSVR